jgi:hypothetical protein
VRKKEKSMQGLGHENVKELREEIGGLMAWLKKGDRNTRFFHR